MARRETAPVILAVVADGGAVGRYRLLNPLTVLAARGVRVRAFADAPAQADVDAADLVLLQRQHDPAFVALATRARARGIPVIYEIDDDLWSIPRDNPTYALCGPGSPVPAAAATLLAACHGVVVSTPELAQAVAAHQPRCRVVPNVIDFALRDWRTPAPGRPPAARIVGWAGGATHQHDLELLREPLRRLLARHTDVGFGLYSTPGIIAWVEQTWALPAGRLLPIPYREFAQHPGPLAWFDIGLAPLRDTPFNRCKSELKLLEYGAHGVPCVASRVAPYARVVDDGSDGRLVGDDPAAWERALDAWLDDDAARRAAGARAAARVRRDHALEHAWTRWPRAWAELARDSGLVLPPLPGNTEHALMEPTS